MVLCVPALWFLCHNLLSAQGVGYGDIYPLSDEGRAFFAVYMLVASVIVADLIGKCIEIYVQDIVGEGINQKVISSTIWVHKSDLNRNGDCTEADYVGYIINSRPSSQKAIPLLPSTAQTFPVGCRKSQILFKLQQLQKLDTATLSRLVDRFAELDGGGAKGELMIGQEIPSAEQVKALQAKQKARQDANLPDKSLQALWDEVKPRFRNGVQINADPPTTGGGDSGGDGGTRAVEAKEIELDDVDHSLQKQDTYLRAAKRTDSNCSEEVERDATPTGLSSSAPGSSLDGIDFDDDSSMCSSAYAPSSTVSASNVYHRPVRMSSLDSAIEFVDEK